MKILEVYQNPSTLVPVLIVKLLRQAFKWYICTIGILIGTVWGQMFHFWNFSQNTLSP
jgi:hypothetical protein